MFAASDLSRRTEHDHPGRVVDGVILNQGSATCRRGPPPRSDCIALYHSAAQTRNRRIAQVPDTCTTPGRFVMASFDNQRKLL